MKKQADNVALIVVFNHRFDKNLPYLRTLYNGKFQNVFFLVPFYDGFDEDVIPVYYPSNCFQGFFQTAYQHLVKYEFDYWFVVADDMLVNPKLDETNVISSLCLSTNDSFIPAIQNFTPSVTWPHTRNALSLKLDTRFLESRKELPSTEEWYTKLLSFNLQPFGVSFDNVYGPLEDDSFLQNVALFGKRYLADIERKKNGDIVHLEYPLCFGYSDIFAIGKDSLERFCHYCGVFAAAGLFVEIAIPTALVLATKGTIRFEKDIEYSGKALWGSDVTNFFHKYDRSLKDLISDFPSTFLYLHPVKLSQWTF